MSGGKITYFFAEQDKRQAATRASGQRQGTILDMKKVQRLQKSSICVDDEELLRLLNQMAEGRPETVIDQALKHLACYILQIEQLERVPLAPRIKELRHHHNLEISRTATNLVEKLREEFAATTVRRRYGNHKADAKPAVKQQAKLIRKSPIKPENSPVKACATLPGTPTPKPSSAVQRSPQKQLAVRKTPTKRTPSKRTAVQLFASTTNV